MVVSRSFFVRVFADDLPAGFPSPAEGYEDEPLDLHRWLVRNPPATFLHPLDGDFLDEHLLHGCILVVDRSVPAVDGKLILAESGGRFVVLRLRNAEAVVDRYPDLIFCGVVVGVVRRM